MFGYTLELPVEVCQIIETTFKGNIHNVLVICGKQFTGVPDSHRIEILHKSDPILLFEEIAEGGDGHVRHVRHFRKGNVLVKVVQDIFFYLVKTIIFEGMRRILNQPRT